MWVLNCVFPLSETVGHRPQNWYTRRPRTFSSCDNNNIITYLKCCVNNCVVKIKNRVMEDEFIVDILDIYVLSTSHGCYSTHATAPMWSTQFRKCKIVGRFSARQRLRILFSVLSWITFLWYQYYRIWKRYGVQKIGAARAGNWTRISSVTARYTSAGLTIILHGHVASVGERIITTLNSN